MSIDARVVDVVSEADTSGKGIAGYLVLVDRQSGRDGVPDGIKGQSRLNFRYAPVWVNDLKGKDIWGGANSIMYEEQEIATRHGYTRIVFTADKLHGLGPKAAAEAAS